MSQSNISIILGFISLNITIIGWKVADYYQRKRENDKRKIESHIKSLENQLEFYGSLYSLIKQITYYSKIQTQYKNKWKKGEIEKNDYLKIKNLMLEELYFPLHQEVRQLIKSKLYLTKELEISERFKQYLRHSTKEFIQKLIGEELYKKLGGEPFPSGFANEIKGEIIEIQNKIREAENRLPSVGINIHYPLRITAPLGGCLNRLANRSIFYTGSKFADRKLIICPRSYSLTAHIIYSGSSR